MNNGLRIPKHIFMQNIEMKSRKIMKLGINGKQQNHRR
jgi:hypothetical protein